MFLYFFVEEQSMEVALKYLLPKMIPENLQYLIFTFEGKLDLLKNIQNRLTAYANWVPEDYYFIVLVDRDYDDCHELKEKLEEISQKSGLISKSEATSNQRFNIINRIVIEELEAWYFGDPDALKEAFPRLPSSFENRKKYRNPERIFGGTWEALEYLLNRSGYYETGLAKVNLALEVAPFMKPNNNRTKSFQVFYQGLLDLLEQ
jgi:hypothetical protein